jgi:hypothetical protein
MIIKIDIYNREKYLNSKKYFLLDKNLFFLFMNLFLLTETCFFYLHHFLVKIKVININICKLLMI